MSSNISNSSLYSKLFQYQKDVINRAIERESVRFNGISGGILSLEMGLGKTVISVVLSDQVGTYPEITGRLITQKIPTLIVVPRSLIENYRSHIESWSPKSKYVILHTDYDNYTNNYTHKQLMECDYIITTYGIIGNTYNKEISRKDGLLKELDTDSYNIRNNSRKPSPYELENIRGTRLIYLINFKRIMCDEAHKMTNYRSRTFKSLISISSYHRWCITGTPFRNKHKDLWTLLKFCGMNIYDKPGTWKIHSLHKEYNTENSSDKTMKEVIISMNYKQANIKLPDMITHNISYNFTPKERAIYTYVENDLLSALNSYAAGLYSMMIVLTLFLRLRQVCIAPYLITMDCMLHYGGSNKDFISPSREKESIENEEYSDSEEEYSEDVEERKENKKKNKITINDEDLEYENKYMEEQYRELDKLTKGGHSWLVDKYSTSGMYSSKINSIIEKIIKPLVYTDEKIIIFSNFSRSLHLIGDRLNEYIETLPINVQKKFKYMVLDGKTPNRDRVVSAFNKDGKFRVLLTSYSVGGDGLNLVSANHAVLVDPWWCPSVHRQAIRRIWRIGQTKTCNVYELFAESSIESLFIKECVLKEKDHIENYLLYNGKFSEEEGKLTLFRIQELISKRRSILSSEKTQVINTDVFRDK